MKAGSGKKIPNLYASTLVEEPYRGGKGTQEAGGCPKNAPGGRDKQGNPEANEVKIMTHVTSLEVFL